MPLLPASAEPYHAADQRTADGQYYRGVLHELIDIGADLARMVLAKAQAEAAADLGPGTDPLPDATIAFDRIARTVRRSIALARRLDEPVPAHAAGNGVQLRIAARKCIIREVEDAIQRHPTDALSLHAEFVDRLDQPDLDDDIGGRPTADIIADICRDLGIAAPPGTQPWKRRTPADLATLHTRAARPYAAAADPPTRPPGRAAPTGRCAEDDCPLLGSGAKPHAA